MNIWAAIKKAVNSDLNTPLDVTLGKKSDAAGNTSGTSSLFAYLKDTNSKAASAASGAGARKAIFTANGTFVVPAGVTCIKISAIAAGGDGGGLGSSHGGGGCGKFIIDKPFAVTPGSSIAITVGVGNTIVGSLATLTKGANGSVNNNAGGIGIGGEGCKGSGAGGNAGAATTTGVGNKGSNGGDGGGALASRGGIGGLGATNTPGYGCPGGPGGGGGVPAIFAKDSNGSLSSGAGGDGGDSGIDNRYGTVGSPGGSYGAGGGGGGYCKAGGIGGPGVVIIEW